MHFLYFIYSENPGNGGCHLYGYKDIIARAIYVEDVFCDQKDKLIFHNRNLNDFGSSLYNL